MIDFENDERFGVVDGKAPTLTLSGKPIHPQASTIQLGKGYYAVLDRYEDNTELIAELRTALGV
jgi:hypothetical protein